jgi:succinate-semialdehyde dehydrogenase/glutarate-semialdehyde dehydrogenase
MTDTLLFIDGAWCPGGGAGEPVIDPATEREIGRVAHASVAELDAAADAAARAFRVWRESRPDTRAALLAKVAETVAARREDLARIMTAEQGKPIAEALGEWDRVVDTFAWTADAARRLAPVAYPDRGTGVVQEGMPTPLGPVLALTAWNFPAILPARKLAPAIAAGCSVVLKASEETPASAAALIAAIAEAGESVGAPRGLVNLVFGVPAEVSEHLIARDDIRKISFTGSVPVGKRLAALAAPRLQRLTLELGGHAPAIVREDADLETALDLLAGFKFRNAGQVCIAPSRFFVHASLRDRFVDGFAARARAVRIGVGTDPDTTMGPMTNARRVSAMRAFRDDALAKGAREAAGGLPLPNRGHFVSPSVLAEVPDDARVLREEPFCPIVPIQAYDREDEMIEKANALEYGLAAYLFTASETAARRIASALEAGSVAVNAVTPAMPDTPFGGMKASGLGYEGGVEGIDGFLHKKLVSRSA